MSEQPLHLQRRSTQTPELQHTQNLQVIASLDDNPRLKPVIDHEFVGLWAGSRSTMRSDDAAILKLYKLASVIVRRKVPPSRFTPINAP